MSSRSCACSHELRSEFHDLHLVVSVCDWSVMFMQVGREQHHIMCAYISVADTAECMQRQGQRAKGSGCGSGWDWASSGRTELRVDTTGGAQGGVGCHGRDRMSECLNA